MENKFFTFINPFLNYIDSGKFYRHPFKWLYIFIAIANILLPFYVIYQAISNKIFNLGADVAAITIISFVVLTIVSWFSFQLWWNRKEKLVNSSKDGDEFVATPVFSHFIQTFGEWVGMWIAIVGTTFSLLTALLYGSDAFLLMNSLGLSFIKTGVLFIFLWPIYGFFIIVITKLYTELIKALAAIANNTKDFVKKD